MTERPMISFEGVSNPEELFDLQEKIGEGTFGVVWRAMYKPTSEIFALKIIPIPSKDDFDAIMKEIIVMRELFNENLVNFHGSFLSANDQLWIVLQLCAVGSMYDVIRVTQAPFNEMEISAILKRVVGGLEYLHAHNTLHRDIKADNIMLDENGHSRLADFGVAGQIKHAYEKRNTVIGSPFWMAPEVIQEVGYGLAADVWSLGITAIELAEGKPPLADHHPMRALFLIPSSPAPRLTNPSHFSEDFVNFVDLCLQKNPAERASAKDLLQHRFLATAAGDSILTDRVEEVLRYFEAHPRVDDDEDEDEDGDSGTDTDSSNYSNEEEEEEGEEEEEEEEEDSRQPRGGKRLLRGRGRGAAGASASGSLPVIHPCGTIVLSSSTLHHAASSQASLDQASPSPSPSHPPASAAKEGTAPSFSTDHLTVATATAESSIGYLTPSPTTPTPSPLPSIVTPAQSEDSPLTEDNVRALEHSPGAITPTPAQPASQEEDESESDNESCSSVVISGATEEISLSSRLDQMKEAGQREKELSRSTTTTTAAEGEGLGASGGEGASAVAASQPVLTAASGDAPATASPRRSWQTPRQFVRRRAAEIDGRSAAPSPQTAKPGQQGDDARLRMELERLNDLILDERTSRENEGARTRSAVNRQRIDFQNKLDQVSSKYEGLYTQLLEQVQLLTRTVADLAGVGNSQTSSKASNDEIARLRQEIVQLQADNDRLSVENALLRNESSSSDAEDDGE